MYIKLANGKVYDPVHGINGEQRDIYIHNGVITRKPNPNTRIDKTFDLKGKVIMAGAIDIHTHIGGGKVNIARMMLPEDHQADLVERTRLTRSGCGYAAPSTLTTGYRYAEMGYTACFEPAMVPSNARQSHMEMADTPMVDKGAYAMLGSDDFFLRMLSSKKDQAAISDYVGWTINASKALGIKVVNPGGISAFKFNQRELDLDEQNQYYGVSPRQILLSLARAVTELGIPHPLHVHGCNLGVPGNMDTTLETIRATEGMRMHLTHIQFHSYGTEGDRKFSSGAAEIAEAINSNPNISCDVGQVLFNQTVTCSGDSQHQYAGHWHAHPKKWVIMDLECDAGCGVVPFRYRDKNFVNALQWAIGLELFLMVNDPWRIFLTTDHPNGAPFTSYPHLIRLLMDKSFRNDMLATINPDAAAASTLASIDREYSLYEIAIMTRAAPARSLGLKNRGHLGAGAIADITVYSNHKDKEKMFSKPDYVFKDGELIVRNGKIVKVVNGGTHILKPGYDKGIERSLKRYFDDYQTVSLGNYKIDDDEIVEHGSGKLIVQPCM
ncbi:MAG: formylmethanofuran dehydrogenase subunit A [Gammaproteobacteria bacterium]